MANRLTEKDKQGNWGLKGVAWVNLMPGAAITQEVYEKLYGALWKLKDYEDTGLNPKEVCRLKERDIPKKGIAKKITVGNNKGLHEFYCPVCYENGDLKNKCNVGEYCSDCGQRLDWSE